MLTMKKRLNKPIRLTFKVISLTNFVEKSSSLNHIITT